MFDPYHQWLSIPPGERPPTCYQLLGVAVDETDPEVIDQAARRQATHLRGYQNGPNAADCARLLKEVAQARATLLDPAKRNAYDAELVSVESVEQALPFDDDPGNDALAELSAAATAAQSRGRAKAASNKPKSWLTMGVIFGALLHVVGGGLLV